MNTPSTVIDSARKQSASPSFAHVRHLILLCPDLHETGGIGMVSRLALRALQSYTTATGGDGQVWSYRDPAADGSIPQSPRWAIQYARGRKTTAALWGLKGGLSDGRDTVVVAMHLHLAPLALPLVKRGARLAVFLHGIEAWTPLSGLRTRALERSALLLANSHHTIDRFKKANPVFADTAIRTCLLGVPESESATAQPTIAGPYALIVGRLSSQERYKGHDTLLLLWRETIKVCPTARLIIAGDGDDRDRLENAAKGLGLTGAVSFLGKVTNQQLEALYRDCSFFVMPSGGEGFGLVFLEAMRAGKACLAAQGAAEEVIENGVTGVIVPAHDRKALLTAITGFFRDPELATQMGHAGRERYQTHFTQMHFEGRFLAALDLRAQTGEI